ncbi:ATP-binding protein [Rhodanobacter sp. KK11]|uniref:ATP-binding protein n=1 Tax=Rhodanobacter sp. KK11 TaxID=3083255 RepID=UPI002966012A|nr:ATP-binding protein [Rhodanobacter sp. KK11]MDW2981754.1 ATP-binding protein [Rhodanobacter sp. KK11]
MTTPMEHLAGLVIGTVESVAPSEIRVILEASAPQSTAFNTGTPVSFPRLNGYVLVPNEAGATVGFVAWIGTERAAAIGDRGRHELGLVDLPFPQRRMVINPIGTLVTRKDKAGEEPRLELQRGVIAFPSVGDQVLIPTPKQVSAIVGAQGTNRRVRIGTSPMANDAPIHVDPDKIFGRHLAVLGNTGSGKSCSVAGMIRWSLEAAAAAKATDGQGGAPNARFIVLDPNGEYTKAFQDIGRVRVFRPGDADNPLQIPAWLWNSHEWTAISQAQPGTQRPLLNQALRNMRAGREAHEPAERTAARILAVYRTRLNAVIADGSFIGFPGRQDTGSLLSSLAESLAAFAAKIQDENKRDALEHLAETIAQLLKNRENYRKNNKIFYNDFSIEDFEEVVHLFDVTQAALPMAPLDTEGSEDAPIQFDVSLFADFIEELASSGTTGANVSNFIAFLTLRIRSMMSTPSLKPVILPDEPVSLVEWLEGHIGSDGSENGAVAVIDLSMVPSEATYTLIAVFARLVFETSQRYRKSRPGGEPLPTVLVLEEAHTFIKRGRDGEDGLPSPSRLCRETFERIAREGRKFGVGLVLSSQRPSELSPTVLAQCNTFLLHRIVNDSDQDLVQRLVPDNVGALLRDLPSLPSRQAILLGWATPLPVLVEMSELSKDERPQSEDPDFWDVWTGKSERAIDWVAIADEWTG